MIAQRIRAAVASNPGWTRGIIPIQTEHRGTMRIVDRPVLERGTADTGVVKVDTMCTRSYSCTNQAVISHSAHPVSHSGPACNHPNPAIQKFISVAFRTLAHGGKHCSRGKCSLDRRRARAHRLLPSRRRVHLSRYDHYAHNCTNHRPSHVCMGCSVC